MVTRFAALRLPDSAAHAAAIERLRPDDVQAHGGVALFTWGTPAHTSLDGRAAGVLVGVVWNDLAVAARLAERGLALPTSDHGRLATEVLGAGGPRGLGSMRWQGSVACLHRAQRLILVARDLLGAGGLWHAAGTHPGLADSDILASDPGDAALVGTARPVPAGLCAVLGERELTWQAQRTDAENAAYFRHVPNVLQDANSNVVADGLRERLTAATAAALRGLGALQWAAPMTPAQAWLAALASAEMPSQQAEQTGQTGGYVTLTGAESLLGSLPAPDLPPPAAPGPWPQAELPEPMGGGVTEADRQQRLLRVTWLADGLLPAEQARARSLGLTLVAPHLDPAVLAWLGAVPAAVRPRLHGQP